MYTKFNSKNFRSFINNQYFQLYIISILSQLWKYLIIVLLSYVANVLKIISIALDCLLSYNMAYASYQNNISLRCTHALKIQQKHSIKTAWIVRN